MRRFLLTFSYMGTSFRGVQKKIDVEDRLKPDPESVQGILEIALKRLKPINCSTVFVSSRTDKGVHGLENAAHVDLQHPQGDSPTWPEFMIHGMNRYFCKAKADVRIKTIQPVPDSFHSRYNAKSRTYLYRIAVQKSAWSSDISHDYSVLVPMAEWKRCFIIGNPNFDVDKVKEAASYFIGLKDFITFTGRGANLPEGYSTVRRINSMTVSSGLPLLNSIYDPINHMYDFWDIVVNAKSFCYRQVRRMVAVLVAVAQNKIEVNEVKNMIEDPKNYGWNPRATTAPPYGLYLVKVEYDPQDLIFPSLSVDEKKLEVENNCEICSEEGGNMSFLSEIASKRKGLRHCQTVITNAVGESFLEDSETGSLTKVSDSNSNPGFVIDYKPDLQLAEIIPGLYLGSQDPTGNKELLQASGITNVLSLGVKPLDVSEKLFDNASDVSEINSVVDPQTNISFVFIPFLDLPEASLTQVLPKCINVIDSVLSTSGRIFVHCNAGVSRSPSVILAYILYRSYYRKPWAFISFNGNSDKPLCLLEAIEILRAQRPCIKPNSGFLDQLRQYECRLIQENVGD